MQPRFTFCLTKAFLIFQLKYKMYQCRASYHIWPMETIQFVSFRNLCHPSKVNSEILTPCLLCFFAYISMGSFFQVQVHIYECCCSDFNPLLYNHIQQVRRSTSVYFPLSQTTPIFLDPETRVDVGHYNSSSAL